MKRFVIIAVGFLLMTGCSKDGGKNYTVSEVNGVTVYSNSTRPSVDDLTLAPRQLFQIDAADEDIKNPGRELSWPRFLDIDSKGNIFILDLVSASVKKFDREGNFIKSFGRNGNGPGEMKSPYLLAILNDVVYVTDPYVQRMVTFDTEGNFRGNIYLKGGLPNFLQSVGNEKFIAFMTQFKQEKDGLYLKYDLVLMNPDFEPIAVLRKYTRKFDPSTPDVLDRFTHYAVGKDKIFVAQNSEERYRIDVFDFSGERQYGIEKDYQRTAFRQDELNELNDTMRAFYKKAGRSNFQPIKKKYKKSINGLYCDKEGRLLVASSLERDETNRYDFLVDVFKEGIFLKRVKLDICKGYDYLKVQEEKLFFKGDRIYHINEPEITVQVFGY
jgi:hypothetical protein